MLSDILAVVLVLIILVALLTRRRSNQRLSHQVSPGLPTDEAVLVEEPAAAQLFRTSPQDSSSDEVRSLGEPAAPREAEGARRAEIADRAQEVERTAGEPNSDTEGEPMRGFTHRDFEGEDSSTLRYWFDWWRNPAREQHGEEEAGRRPDVEAAKVYAELEARYEAGILHNPPGGLREAMRVEIRFVSW